MALPTSGYYVEVDLEYTQVVGSTNLSGFVALLTRDVDNTAGDWADLFDPSGTPANTNGTDIRCADSTGTQIPCEVVSYSEDTSTGAGDGELILWVRVPTLNATSSNTTIRVYWDGTTGSVETDTGVTPADVWQDYEAVWHMNESGSISTVADATGSHDLTNYAGGNISQAGTDTPWGQPWLNCNTSNNMLRTTGSSAETIFDGATAFTISHWINADTTGDSYFGITDSSGYLSPTEDAIELRADTRGYIRQSTGDADVFGGGSSATTDYFNAWRFNGTDFDNRRDKSTISTTTSNVPASIAVASADVIHVGARAVGIARSLDGRLSEFRIRREYLSNDWVDTEYNNQNSVSTFATAGAKTTIGSSSTDYDLAGDKGALTVTGGAATYDLQLATVDSELVADKGTLTVTGDSSSLEVFWKLQAQTGVITVTGGDAAFDTNLQNTLAGDKGSVSVVGNSATFGVEFEADTATVTVAGGEAALGQTQAGSFAGDKGTILVQGSDASLEVSYVSDTATAEITVAGGQAEFSVGQGLAADKGSISPTSNAAEFTLDVNLDAEKGTVTVAGGDANYQTGTPQDSTLDGDKATITLTANTSVLEARLDLYCPTGVINCKVNEVTLVGPPRGGGVGVEDISHIERLKRQQQRLEYLIKKDDEEVAAIIVAQLVA